MKEIYDFAIKVDSTISANDFMFLIDDLSRYVCHIFWDSVEHDEKYIYLEIQYYAQDERELMDFIKKRDWLSVDYDAMSEWV